MAEVGSEQVFVLLEINISSNVFTLIPVAFWNSIASFFSSIGQRSAHNDSVDVWVHPGDGAEVFICDKLSSIGESTSSWAIGFWSIWFASFPIDNILG
jgi:hypothetical protein